MSLKFINESGNIVTLQEIDTPTDITITLPSSTSILQTVLTDDPSTGNIKKINNTSILGTGNIDVTVTSSNVHNAIKTLNYIELTNDLTGNRYSGIDFHGDDTNTDYALRLHRENTGVNANSTLIHKGTGDLILNCYDTGSEFKLYSANVQTLNVDSNGTVTLSGTYSNVSGSANIFLNSATGNRIDFAAAGTGAPSLTARSIGTKITLYPNVNNVDYAVGIESNSMWHSIPASAAGYKWYAGETVLATLNNTGVLYLSGSGPALNISNASSSARTINVFQNTGASGSTFTIRSHGSGYSETLFGTDVNGDTALMSNAGDIILGTYGANNLILGTNNAARITINSSGGIATPGTITNTATYSATTGSANIYLNSTTGNRIDFNGNGVAAPAYTTRSAGTKIVLFPGITGSAVDYGFGIESNTLWSSIPTSAHAFKWYAGTSSIATLTGAGALTVSGNITASGGTVTATTFSGNATTATTASYVTSANRQTFTSSQSTGTLLSATGSLGGIELQCTGSNNAAFMSFHKPNTYAAYFGLDTDHQFTCGGWSAGAAMSSMKVGSFGVGTAASGTAGEIRATNNITGYYSDERLKTLHGTIPNALDKVLALNGYYFTENQTAKNLGYNNDKIQVGLSAQEVEQVLPEIVTDAPIGQGYKTIWYEKMVPLLIEAIKDQQKMINAQNNKINELESMIRDNG